jgi:predicted transcriptional regulator of viral defense system
MPKEVSSVNPMEQRTGLGAKASLHLGSRAAVDQALSRLVRRGNLMRASRGIYVRPVQGKFGSRPPSVATLVRTLCTRRGKTIAPHGAAAANALGLTTQVPAREVYLTSGRSRQLRLRAQTVELRHAPSWQLLLPERPAGAASGSLQP